MFPFTRPCSRNAQYDAERPLTEGDKHLEPVRSNVAPRSSEGGLASASLLGAISAHTCRRITVRLLILLLVALVVPRAAHTQVLYGSLTGQVTDQKGAAVPRSEEHTSELQSPYE